MKLKIIFCTDYANDSGFIEKKIRSHNLNRMMSRRSETGLRKFDRGHQDKTFIFCHKEPFRRYLSTQTFSNFSNIDGQNHDLYNADFHLHSFRRYNPYVRYGRHRTIFRRTQQSQLDCVPRPPILRSHSL